MYHFIATSRWRLDRMVYEKRTPTHANVGFLAEDTADITYSRVTFEIGVLLLIGKRRDIQKSK